MKNMLCLSPVIDPVGVVNVEIYMVHVEIWSVVRKQI